MDPFAQSRQGRLSVVSDDKRQRRRQYLKELRRQWRDQIFRDNDLQHQDDLLIALLGDDVYIFEERNFDVSMWQSMNNPLGIPIEFGGNPNEYIANNVLISNESMNRFINMDE